ncbi:hypothetical protein PENVUL_c064G09786 [Penicillium vulpinum]|uniref:Major facilitator superfamily (MFS) profile domain-containing protein n=1 Tax=Penicillium vulpinum TaxID=29845 RepID=A0A1V6RCW1_9EURO|nr:hypothetical protein PENVUL_c064G09786 [Penicillium vulpinum]
MARLLSACNAVSYLFFSDTAVHLTERMGCRGLMLLSTFGQFVCFLVIIVLLGYAETNENDKLPADADEGCCSRNCYRLDYELHRRVNHPDQNSEYWLGSPLLVSLLTVIIANRSLEDFDAYYCASPSLIVSGDPGAICWKRPQNYIEREDEEFERTAGKGVMSVAEHL